MDFISLSNNDIKTLTNIIEMINKKIKYLKNENKYLETNIKEKNDIINQKNNEIMLLKTKSISESSVLNELIDSLTFKTDDKENIKKQINLFFAMCEFYCKNDTEKNEHIIKIKSLIDENSSNITDIIKKIRKYIKDEIMGDYSESYY
jgi:chromosome segregation ATPase